MLKGGSSQDESDEEREKKQMMKVSPLEYGCLKRVMSKSGTLRRQHHSYSVYNAISQNDISRFLFAIHIQDKISRASFIIFSVAKRKKIPRT